MKKIPAIPTALAPQNNLNIIITALHHIQLVIRREMIINTMYAPANSYIPTFKSIRYVSAMFSRFVQASELAKMVLFRFSSFCRTTLYCESNDGRKCSSQKVGIVLPQATKIPLVDEMGKYMCVVETH